MIKNKEYMSSKQLILGLEADKEDSGIRFSVGSQSLRNEKKKMIGFDLGSHMVTIAPTGSGKSRYCVIPELLSYDGPVIALDIKGELSMVTKRRREEMGRNVVVLDPFKRMTTKTDTLNPFDIALLEGFELEDDAQTLASVFSSGNEGSRDPYWDNAAKNLLAAVFSYIMMKKNAKDRSFAQLKKMMDDDFNFNIAKILDTEKNLPSNIKIAFTGYLSLPDNSTRPCVLQTLTSYLNGFNSSNIDLFLSKSSFDLLDVVKGNNTDIFLIIPPDKLKSHKNLIKMIISVLFKALLSRKVIPEQKTLLILDECSGLGEFSLLEAMIAQCRGYGVCIHTLWQDLSQMKALYPVTFESILNNSGVWQIFGNINYRNAKMLSEFLGISISSVKDLRDKQQLLLVNNYMYERAVLFDYLKDKRFQGMFDSNSYYNNFHV